MTERKIVIPNDASGFLVEEIRQRLGEGYDVTLAFGGRSMLPLINDKRDTVVFEPLRSELSVGDIYLFIHCGRCVVHRLMKVRGNHCVFRGDNCLSEEHVERDAVLARLKTVLHSDGTSDSCDTPSWRRRSRYVASRRTVINWLKKAISRRNRLWERWVYFALLILLMWAPLGGLGVHLNNFVLGIRLDHLLHASVYLPCVVFLMDFPCFLRHKTIFLWVTAVVIGLTTETVQYLLPYRGFDINDLIANTLGVSLGFFVLIAYYTKRIRNSRV